MSENAPLDEHTDQRLTHTPQRCLHGRVADHHPHQLLLVHARGAAHCSAKRHRKASGLRVAVVEGDGLRLRQEHHQPRAPTRDSKHLEERA